MKDAGPLTNVITESNPATLDALYDAPSKIDISTSEWDFIRGKTKPFQTLGGEITTNKTLIEGVVYKLNTKLIVKSGATLTIEAGTKITAVPGNDVYIATLKGGKVAIKGSAQKPVVMSTADPKNDSNKWGGLLLTGSAPTTGGVDISAEVAGLLYGGTDPADNSGSIKYLVIRGAGAVITGDKQFNGLTLYGVGSGTTIENISIIDGNDDGIEFFGGTVSVKNLYLENNQDDAIDWTEGWNGTITNAYASSTNAKFSTIVEADKDNGNPKLINLTAVSSVGGTALQFKKQSGATITNLFLEGYDTNIEMANDGPLSNIIIEGEAATLDGVYVTGKLDISTWTWKDANL